MEEKLQAKELRIGNLVQSNIEYSDPSVDVKEGGTFAIKELSNVFRDGDCTLSSYDHMGASSKISSTKCSPIPLTPEWLERMGFKNYPNSTRMFLTMERGNLLHVWTENSKYLLIDFNSQSIARIQYVHSMQNLFCALTGQEIEIKELVT